MKKFILILIILAIYAPLFGQNQWSIDKSHSSITFSVSHMVVSDVTGNFKSLEGTVESKKDDFSDAKINVKIDVASINTDDEKRDTHLKSEEFFDAAKFPAITFESKELKKISGNDYTLSGKLTMHGVSRDVEMKVVNRGTVSDPWGNTRAGFKGKITVNRMDYGVNFSKKLDNGGLIVGNDVDITFNVELLKKKEEMKKEEPKKK